MSLLRLLFPAKDPATIKRLHKIPDKIHWKIELNPKGFVATSEELPGLVTNAKDPQELLVMINDAVLEYFDVSKRDSDFVFDTLNLDGQGTVVLKQAARRHQLA